MSSCAGAQRTQCRRDGAAARRHDRHTQHLVEPAVSERLLFVCLPRCIHKAVRHTKRKHVRFIGGAQLQGGGEKKEKSRGGQGAWRRADEGENERASGRQVRKRRRAEQQGKKKRKKRKKRKKNTKQP